MSLSATISAWIRRWLAAARDSVQRCCVGTLVALALTGLLAGCSPFPETWEWNQKLTIEVSTPEGLVVGSAVTEVRWRDKDIGGNFAASYEGEATVVDLGPRGFMFALIGEETKYIALHTFREDIRNHRGSEKHWSAIVMKLSGTREVPRKRYPLLVTFTDLSDPATVKQVDPDNLAAAFGPGVSLKRIVLEITDERPTKESIQKALPWWNNLVVPIGSNEKYGHPLHGIGLWSFAKH